MDFIFFTNSVLLGVGLAMDAFSVSVANGLNEPDMPRGKMFGIPGMFAFFRRSCLCSAGYVYIPS